MSPLERRTPLTRKTPLAAGEPLARKTPLARTATPPMSRTPLARAAPARTEPGSQASGLPARKARRPVDTGASATARKVVFERDGGRCVRCGMDLTSGTVSRNDHHRQGRGMGGRQGAARAAANLPSRRLTLCGSGTTGCHGWVTSGDVAAAERAGLVVRRGGGIDPAEVPVLTWRGWVLLDDEGGAERCPAPPGDDARESARVQR